MFHADNIADLPPIIGRLNILVPVTIEGAIHAVDEIYLNGNTIIIRHPLPANTEVIEDGGQVVYEPVAPLGEAADNGINE